MNGQLIKPLLLVAVVLVLPLVAIAIWGESFASIIQHWQESPPAPLLMAAAIVAILAADVFLPVPSGPVSTLAGSELGFLLGTATSALGMTLGATLAFGLARRWGRPVAEHFSSPEQVAELEDACRQHGPWMLILTRPLPVLAEACALLVGALQMTWQSFLPTVIVSNLLIAATPTIATLWLATRGTLRIGRFAASVRLVVAQTIATLKRRAIGH